MLNGEGKCQWCLWEIETKLYYNSIAFQDKDPWAYAIGEVMDGEYK